MKHKLSALLLALVMAAALAAPALADVMWEPYGNSFYESHRDECTYVSRGYLANGQEGYITLRSAPDSLVEVSNLANGERLYVGMTWQAKDGSEWAVGEYSVQNEAGDRTWYTGWVPLSELALIYDYIAFEEDHGAEFQEYDGSGDKLTEVCLYSYPGGVYSYTLEENRDYQPFSEAFQHLYTDENGLHWTFVGYYMGRNNAWVCLDDPMNEKLGADTPRTVGQVRGTGEEIAEPADSVPAAKTYMIWLIPAILVAAVAVVTAVLVRKKNKKA